MAASGQFLKKRKEKENNLNDNFTHSRLTYCEVNNMQLNTEHIKTRKNSQI